jgi:hypothetical protein
MIGHGFTDDGIGRLLVASLHQGIGDEIPLRLEYYEHWLGPMGLRDARSGLAPLGAVLSFLRQEGRPVYDAVMTRAGRASAEWYVAEHGGGMRVARWLPRPLRRRHVLRQGRALVRAAFAPADARVGVRRGTGRVELQGSVFCVVREPWPWPTCTYFAAALGRWLELHEAAAAVHVDACRATGAPCCRLDVEFGARQAGERAS